MEQSQVKDWADAVGAIASLAWPVLAAAAVYKFGPSLTGLLKRDNVSIEVGGFKLSSQQAIGKIGLQLRDLQNKIIEIEFRLPPKDAKPAMIAEGGREIAKAFGVIHILWVDDNPENNAFIIGSLDKDTYSVSIARSTSEALRACEATKFEIVITDMGRIENGRNNETAGLDLLQMLKERGDASRKALFTTHQSANQYGDQARAAGAELVTASPTDIVAFIMKR